MSIERVRDHSEPAEKAAVEVSETTDSTAILGANLRRLRVRRGLSLERLARASGVFFEADVSARVPQHRGH